METDLAPGAICTRAEGIAGTVGVLPDKLSSGVRDRKDLLMRTRKPVVVAVLWLFSVGVLLLPGGVLTQIWRADERFNERVAESPLGKLCYRCNRPAVVSARYDDGSVRYFCKHHDPPEQMRATSSGDQGQKGFNPWFCIGLLGVIYGINTLRAVVQLFSTAQFFQASLTGAVIGVVTSGLAWYWFASR